jgi:thiol:disulfide interchange protein DsbC
LLKYSLHPISTGDHLFYLGKRIKRDLKKTMNKILFAVYGLLCGLLLSGYAHGFEGRGQDCSKCHTLNRDEARDLLKDLFPGSKILDVNLSPAKGFWEVYIDSGGRKGITYIDFSKKYLFSGSLISIADRKNLSQERSTQLRRFDISQIPLEDALVMGDEKAPIRVIAFDDPD